MNEKTIETIQRHVRLAFMATVTTCMLALTIYHARQGFSGLLASIVYALTAGFGLEFLRSAVRTP
jgi:hypothetical protein